MFLRPIWQQDSCFHLLPWVLFSLLYKHANQFQNKSEVGEKKKKHLSSFITKLSQYESSLPIPTAWKCLSTWVSEAFGFYLQLTQATQCLWASPNHLKAEKGKAKLVALSMICTVLTMWTFHVLQTAKSQECRHNCDSTQASTADLTSPLGWTKSHQMPGILLLKGENFPHGRRNVLGDKAWGTVKRENIPSPKCKDIHAIKILRIGITDEGMKTPGL